MKYCKKCGNLLDETAISCPSCGAKIEDSSETKPEEPVSFIMPQTQESVSSDFISEAVPEKKKPHKKKILAAIIAVFLVIVGTGAIVYASSDSFKNSMKQAMMKPSEYLQSIFENSFAEIAEDVSEQYSTFLAPITNLTSDKQELNCLASVDLKLNQEFLAPLLESAGLSDVKFENLSANIVSNSKDGKVGGNVLLSVNGQSLVSLNLAGDNKENTFYLQIPELSSAYLKIDAHNFVQQSTSSSQQLGQMISSIFNESMLSPDDVKRILTDYSSLFVDMLTEVDVEKDLTVEASGVKTSYDKYIVSINEKQLKDFLIAFLTKAKNDEKLLGFLENMLQVISKYSETELDIPSFSSDIDKSLKEIEAIKADETVIVANLSFWINEKGEIKGEELNAKNYFLGFLSTEKKNQHGFSLWLKNESTSIFSLDADSLEKDDKYSGSAKFTVSSENLYTQTMQTNTITFDFTDVTTKDTFTGTFTATSSLIPGGSLTLTLTGKSKEREAVLGINYMGMSIATLTFRISNSQKADEIIFPSKSDKIYIIEADGEALYEYLEECNIEELLKRLENSIGIDLSSSLLQ